MKSNAYEMHNYAASLSPDVPQDVTVKKTNSLTKSTNEKYSLRQRQKRKAKSPEPIEEDNEMDDSLDRNPSPILTHRKSHSKRNKNQSKQQQSSNKPRTKAAPLSKYRRKTANARERTRMREINSAFENLRQCVPNVICGEDAGISSEKLTKITTLRLAMKYITILNDALHDPSYDVDFLFESKDAQNNSSLPEAKLLSSTLNEVVEIEPSTAKSAKSTQKSTKTPRKTLTKRTSYKNKLKQQQNLLNQLPPEQRIQTLTNSDYCEVLLSPVSSMSSSSSVCSSRKSIASSSAYSSLSSAHSSPSSTYLNYNSLQKTSSGQSRGKEPNDPSTEFSLNPSTFSDLGSLLLESDGESLNLSETCLSPLHSNYQSSSLITSSLPLEKSIFNETDFISSSSTLDNPLELNLRLLNTNATNLDFNLDNQQPPSCISPLVTLDSFSPFSDLLHNDFTEHNSLDLFLT